MRDKKIKTEVILKIKQGVSKLDIYEQLKDSVDDDKLRNIIASRPTVEQMNKFKTAQLFVCVIWGIFIILELFGILDLIINFDIKHLISITGSFYIAINIWKFDGRFLLPGIIWFLFTIVNSFRDLYNNTYEFDPDFSLFRNLTLIYALILLIGTYMMYYLKKNVFYYYQWFQPELNNENQKKFE